MPGRLAEQLLRLPKMAGFNLCLRLRDEISRDWAFGVKYHRLGLQAFVVVGNPTECFGETFKWYILFADDAQ